MPSGLLEQLQSGDKKVLAKTITMVENDLPGSEEFLSSLEMEKLAPVIGVTGPPGAGKSTLISMMIGHYSALGKKIAVIAVDPTSPFNFGSILGDRLRMAEHFTDPNVFIRSLATRGNLGGLSAKAIEVCDVIRSAGFDLVLIETVGVGQSEVEIAGLADTTVLVLVPESGDDVQAMKSGIVEIADIFVLNKSDRPGANTFIKNLQPLLHKKSESGWTPVVVKTSALNLEGAADLAKAIDDHLASGISNSRKAFLYADRAMRLIQQKRSRDLVRDKMVNEINAAMEKGNFQLYRYVSSKA
ncbi:MAG TPA: methylmalonyl Co-A mutase-associated GTPase MeaB [Bacteroidia bacterium]|jgi:LAO/AO transport system kinase|nr:methylmalonyl Co-A mutase-associated GTPase MeaB [Bacteroidia bacterium]